jgi:hypothetical protein
MSAVDSTCGLVSKGRTHPRWHREDCEGKYIESFLFAYSLRPNYVGTFGITAESLTVYEPRAARLTLHRGQTVPSRLLTSNPLHVSCTCVIVRSINSRSTPRCSFNAQNIPLQTASSPESLLYYPSICKTQLRCTAALHYLTTDSGVCAPLQPHFPLLYISLRHVFGNERVRLPGPRNR